MMLWQVEETRLTVEYKSNIRSTCCTSSFEIELYSGIWLGRLCRHDRMLLQAGVGSPKLGTGWSTRCRALSKLEVISTAWLTAPCRRSATHTTIVLLTRRASSTLTTLHSSPTRSTLSSTTSGYGTAQPSLSSLEWHQITDNMSAPSDFSYTAPTVWQSIVHCVSKKEATWSLII